MAFSLQTDPVTELLKGAKTIAVVGLSDDPLLREVMAFRLTCRTRDTGSFR